MTVADAHRAILAVWRIEQPRLITSLARMLRDVPLAEELTQEALLAALEQWPTTGVPQKPGAWRASARIVVSDGNDKRSQPSLRIEGSNDSLLRTGCLFRAMGSRVIPVKDRIRPGKAFEITRV